MSTRAFTVAATAAVLAVTGVVAQVGDLRRRLNTLMASLPSRASRSGSTHMPGRPTGCTVVVVDGEGRGGGVSQRGGAPGTRETDLLDPTNMVDKVNAVVLSGGSAYGSTRDGRR
jgi:L-aminopeptidase/D-esterase-like protein